ncbi:hypothetical protein PACTADRAFT_31167 [Pachysolen tannophilus NRRL Y-2460]|uniref:Smr domain-containing protein n=1 Tax=Pachysolen tannophilus NRRL Y-2460 TaxID=669874 RepID=A0A1E4U162_PACTA|nr:hypothetical protein PACTADRAFT_31167 [Pachysolen tannophilus NRRL Y-2460]
MSCGRANGSKEANAELGNFPKSNGDGERLSQELKYDDYEFFIGLSKLLQISISDYDLQKSINMATQVLQCGNFLNSEARIDIGKTDFFNSKMKPAEGDDLIKKYPIIQFFANILDEPIPKVLQLLSEMSPSQLIEKKINVNNSTTIELTNINHSNDFFLKKKILSKYTFINNLNNGKNFLNKLYDLVDGNEGFLIVITSLWLCRSLFNTFPQTSEEISERNNEEQVFSNSTKKMDNSESGKIKNVKSNEIAELSNKSYSPTISKLSEMFSHLSLSKIRETVQEVNGDLDKAVDLLLNEDAVRFAQNTKQSSALPETTGVVSENLCDYDFSNENVQDPTMFKENFVFLKEMFPNIPARDIGDTLVKTGNNTVSSIEILLNYKNFKREISNYDSQQMIKLSLKNSSTTTSTKTWAKIDEEAKQVVSLTGIPFEIAKRYYHENDTNIIKTIISIIETYKSVEVEDEANDIQALKAGGKVKGRVQREVPRMSSKMFKFENFAAPAAPAPLAAAAAASPLLQKKKHIYKYDPESNESQVLGLSKHENPILFTVSDKFYERAMEFFNGNIKKVISVATLICEQNCQELTFESQRVGNTGKNENSMNFNNAEIEKENNFTKQEKSEPSINNNSNTNLDINPILTADNYFARAQNYTQMARSSQSSAIKHHYNQLAAENKKKGIECKNSEQGGLQEERLLIAKQTSTLDLHGLSVEVALKTLRKGLQEWWDDELKERELNHGKMNYSSLKAFAIGPMRIITGKGIHSRNGVSQIKKQVKLYLQQHNYIFDDQSSGYIVEGKRH